MASDVFPALKPPYGMYDYTKLLVDADGKLITTATGTMNISAPTGPFEITVVTATAVAVNPLPTPLTARVSLSIRNKSGATTVYFGKNALVTADDSATGGWEIGPNEDFNIDLTEDQVFYLICPAAQSAVVKILEIAST